MSYGDIAVRFRTKVPMQKTRFTPALIKYSPKSVRMSAIEIEFRSMEGRIGCPAELRGMHELTLTGSTRELVSAFELTARGQTRNGVIGKIPPGLLSV
jgi:hypothetical protein